MNQVKESPNLKIKNRRQTGVISNNKVKSNDNNPYFSFTDLNNTIEDEESEIPQLNDFQRNNHQIIHAEEKIEDNELDDNNNDNESDGGKDFEEGDIMI